MKTEDTIQIDGIDKIILNGLMQDARMSINQLAKQVGNFWSCSTPTLKKLEKRAELIQGSQVMVNPKKLGYTTLAFVGIYLDKAMNNPAAVEHCARLKRSLNAITPQVTGVF